MSQKYLKTPFSLFNSAEFKVQLQQIYLYKVSIQMHSLSIFGTSSDAGKSTLSFALTYLLHHRGIRVAPFKAQNVSNNSQVTDDGGEIAIPQFFAADAIAIPSSVFMNPILLKSGGKSKAHIILNGRSVAQKDVWSYYKELDTLKPHVDFAYKTLLQTYDCIVAEGAGSPVELNLMEKDLSNIYIATKFQTKIILVADIERGGVFASLYGLYNLLPKNLRHNVIGVIINKFRGDIRLFDDGVKIIENEFKIPVLGVVPYKPFNLGFEDSQSLMNYVQESSEVIMKVGVLKFPHISNFTDFEPLVADKEIELSFISNVSELNSCDVIILPGSKQVVEDLEWLKKRGFYKNLQSTQKSIIGICGGYEMMFEAIEDSHFVESEIQSTQGLKFFKGSVTFKKKKRVHKGEYNIFGVMLKGYEIHNGTAKKRSQSKKNIYGTFVHGIFENNSLRYKLFSKINPHYKGYDFQKYKEKSIADFAKHIEKNVNIDLIQKSLNIAML